MRSLVLSDDNNWYDRILDRFGRCNGILLIVMAVWFIPAAISTIKGYPLVLDYATNIRTLVSLPLFILSSQYVIRKANWIICHFLKASLIGEDDKENFFELIDSTNRLLNSFKVKVSLVVFVIFFIIAETMYGDPLSLIPWRSFSNPGSWWFYFVSHPIYSYLLIRFLLKAVLWWRFLFKVSRMKLIMRGAHGDGMGGLGFLSTSLNSLIFPALAFSSSAAAGAANLLIYGDMTLNGLKIAFSCFVAGLSITLIGPHLFFIPILMKEREESIHKYGVLSSTQMKQFEEKWFLNRENDALNTGDFSAATDYNSENGRVHSIKFIPIKIIDAITLLIAITIPFGPVFALEMPWQDVLKHMLSILR